MFESIMFIVAAIWLVIAIVVYRLVGKLANLSKKPKSRTTKREAKQFDRDVEQALKLANHR